MLSTFAAFALLAPPAHPIRSAPPLNPSARAIDHTVLDTLKSAGAHDISITLPSGEIVSIALEPIDPLAPGARIVSATKTARGVFQHDLSSDVRCWTGRVAGHTDARAFVASADGFLGGFIQLHDAKGEHTIWLSNGRHGKGLAPMAFDPALAPPGTVPSVGQFCHADELAQPAYVPSQGGVAGAEPPPCREVLLAIDTDVEYTANVFGGNQGAAIAYAIAITAAASEIYTNDLNVRLRVKYVRLWTGDDPWTMGSTVDQLFEYRDYWEANEASVVRDLGHFLSGRGLGGGVAWLPGVCGGQYSYGLSANLGGTFPYPLVDHDGANWDIMVFSHEIGHNFGSPHTHDYDPPLDGCGLGDCSAAWTGTIMSYCHTCAGGMTNISLHFHPGNVVTMLDFLNNIPCAFSGPAAGAIAEDDFVTTGAGQTAVIDFLFNDVRANCEPLSVSSFDATTVNGATVSLLPPPPLGGRPTFSVAIPENANGPDSFEYSIADGAGGSDTATVHLDVFPLLAATNVSGVTLGMGVDYYALGELDVLPDFSTLRPFASDFVSQVNYPSNGGEFATSGLIDLVGAVFEGWVNLPTTGFWTFFSESDDGSKLYVDNQLVVSNDGLHGMVEKAGSVGAIAGRHLLRVEFFERYGGAGEIARLQGPNFAKQVIPKALLGHGGTVSPDLNGDGHVDAADLAMVLGAWGTPGPLGDLNQDGIVDGADLAIVLGGWTG